MIALILLTPVVAVLSLFAVSVLIVRPVRMHWQNLTREASRDTYADCLPKHGRAWWNGREGYEGRSLRVEWTIGLREGLHYGVEIGSGDSGRGLQLHFGIPFALSLYWEIERFFRVAPFGYGSPRYDSRQGQSREIEVYFFERAIWWNLWVGGMADWSRDYSWCKRWRNGSFEFARLLGKQSYSCETLRDGISVEIPMPEGKYHGTAKVERRTWKRALWFARTRVSTYIDVPRGIPFQGKGENSWDCGDDGLFGCGVEGDDVAKAIVHFRDSVLKSRTKHGEPSRRATEALATA